jgi:hypothetical protein
MALQEIKGVIQMHEDLIKGNRDTLGTITVKIQEHENQLISQNATIMGIIAHLNHRVTQLEEECASLRNTHLSQNGISGASNHLNLDIAEHRENREEDTVQQLFEAMEIGDLEPEHSVQGMEEAASCNIF